MRNDVHSQLTILVPTHNRPAFLRRLLTFLAQSAVPFRMLIADSSRADLFAENSAAISQLSMQLRVIHWQTDLGIISKCRAALESVSTPFVVCCADDDFLRVETLAAHVDFLSRHSNYSCSQGILASVYAQRPNEYFAIPSFHLGSPDPMCRFRDMHRRWFTTFYAVYHTEILQRAFQITDTHCDWLGARIFPEILLSQLSVLAGRVNFIPELYLVREEHDLNESVVVPEISDLNAMAESYGRFQTALREEIVNVTGVSSEAALSQIDAAYGHLRHGDQKTAKRRRSLAQRLGNELQRLMARISAPFQRDCIPIRRRLKPSDVSYQEHSFSAARELFERYPTGMSATQFAAQFPSRGEVSRADCA